MGHVGLMPQRVRTLGGFRTQGQRGAAPAVVEDARRIADAGAFAIVLEKVPEPLARTVTQAVTPPVIGIGASPACDGQVLVTEDILGLFGAFRPKFVRRYAELGAAVEKAAAGYAADVRGRRFPGPEHCIDADVETTGKAAS